VARPIAVALALLPLLAVVTWVIAAGAWARRWYRRRGLPLPERPSRGAIGYIVRESWFIFHIIAWWFLAWRRDGWWPGHRARAVVCIHGFSQNGTNFLGIRRRLSAAGHPTMAITLGRMFQPLTAFVPTVHDGLRAALRRSPDGVDVVAHSMGGIVLRMALLEAPELRGHIHRVITLGTPHRGTGAVEGPFGLGPEARALLLDHVDLLALPDLRSLLPHAAITTVAGAQDHVVYPEETAHIDGAERLTFRDVGHAGLLVAPECLDAIITRLA
jgi:pimeloyl-ACP methyl ester carboxylesterase